MVDMRNKTDSKEKVSNSPIDSVNRESSMSKKTLLAVLIGLVILAIAGYYAYSLKSNTNQPSHTTAKQTVGTSYQQQISALQKNADTAKTPSDKSTAYQQLTDVALSNNDVTAAVGYSKTAVKIEPSANAYATLGYALSQSGDHKAAAEAYGKAAAMSTKVDDPTYVSPYNDYLNMQKEELAQL